MWRVRITAKRVAGFLSLELGPDSHLVRQGAHDRRY